MRRTLPGLIVPILLIGLGPAAVATGAVAPAGAVTGGPAEPRTRSFLVVPNQGQFDPAVRYQVRTDGMTLWVTPRSLWITLLEHPLASPAGHGLDSTERNRRGVNLEVTFPGSRAHPSVVASDLGRTRMNYFLGSDPTRWRGGVPT